MTFKVASVIMLSVKYLSLAGDVMSVPSKANIVKLDNPARPKTSHQAGTEPSV